MKQKIMNIIVISIFAWLLSACGSNDIVDGISSESNNKLFETTATKVEMSGLDFSLDIPFEKKVGKDVKLEFKDFNFTLEGCDISSIKVQPEPLVLDGAVGQKETVKITGHMQQSCSATSYLLTADETITEGSKQKTFSNVILLSTGLDSNGNPMGSIDPTAPTVDGNYSFYNVPSSIVIDKPAKEYQFSVQLIDSQLKGVSGKPVTILAYDNNFGKIQSLTVNTDENGYANYIYMSPDTLAAINGKNLPLTVVYDDNGTRIAQTNITLSFNASGGNATSYSFTNATSIIVSAPSQEQMISVDLVDSSGTGVPGKVVKSTVLPRAFGSISPAEATTDQAGRATFHYTAPTDLTSVNGQSENVTLSFTDENDKTITAVATVFIQTASSVYHLSNASTPVTVTQDNEIKTISVDVLNSQNVGVPGMAVTITAVNDIKYGSIVSATTTNTNESGRAFFTYKAPENVAAVNRQSTTVTVRLKDTELSQEINITYDKAENDVTLPILVIADTYKDINITQNGQNAEIQVQVFEEGSNVPYTSGNVKVTLPDSVLTGTDVGYFSSYSVPVGSNGIASFTYVAPQDIRQLIDGGITSLNFNFYHEENDAKKSTVTMHYSLATDYVPADYVVTTSSEDGKQTMGLKSLKTFAAYLKDDQDNLLEDNKISRVTIVSKNTLVGKIIDTSTGNEVSSITLNGANAVNSISFPVQSYELSGLLPVEITFEFTDANGNIVQRTKVMNIVVLSGPPTAMSISYAGVEQKSGIAKYVEKFAITVTDAYNNPVNTQPFVAVGAMVEYAVDGSSATGERTMTSPRLWHGSYDPRATLEQIGGNKAQLTTTVDTFNYVDIHNDKAVVFGAGYVYEATGKWDIDSVNSMVLGLKDDYYGITRNNLGFAVGHNNRRDLCASDQREYVGNMKSNTYQIDENGHVLVEFEYDYHLTGKDIMVWANLTGFQADDGKTGRIGEAIKHTLRGNGLIAVPTDGYSLPKGATNVRAPFAIWHENAPERYRNGHFGWRVKSGSTCAYSIIETTNSYDARDCYANGTGQAYITFSLSAPLDKACTFAIEGITTASEFTSGLHYP